MEKWNRLQTLAREKDELLKENRKQWKGFKRQLEDLELAIQEFTSLNHACKSILFRSSITFSLFYQYHKQFTPEQIFIVLKFSD